jgi:hypothetical protein
MHTASPVPALSDSPAAERRFRSGWVRIPLLVIQLFVALTAFAGGIALVVGSLDPGLGWVIVPPAEYLAGSPFDSYIAPGVILAVVLGGLHLVAFVMVLRRHRWAHLVSAAAGFDALIWIFVQMVFIPFSVLQVVYFAAGMAELGLVLLGLGVMRPLRTGAVGDEADPDRR